MKFLGTVGNWPVNKRSNFGGNPDHGSGYTYRDTGRICLGEGMHCPSASSFILSLHYIKTEHLMCKSH